MKIILILLCTFSAFAQDSFDLLRKLPKERYHSAVADSIRKLEGSDLGNFLYHIQEKDNAILDSQTEIIFEKLATAKGQLSIHLMLTILLKQQFDKQKISDVLESRKQVWDDGEWSRKFWKLITDNKLQVSAGDYYSVNEKGEKIYDTERFVKENIENGKIGLKPLLFLNYNLNSYDESLTDLLARLNIRELRVSKSKVEAPQLYGIRGKDGAIEVLTK